MEKVVLQWLYQCRAVTDIVRQCEILKDTDKVCVCVLNIIMNYSLYSVSASWWSTLMHVSCCNTMVSC